LLQLALGALALYFSRQYHWFLIANLLRSGSTSIGQVLCTLHSSVQGIFNPHCVVHAQAFGRLTDLFITGAAASGAWASARPCLCV